ncbi:hypothetical protein TVAG_332460 [Trichomonas vaginalis G3]|uniref:DUF3447 domain-containing protein n=1 Tax=Trichomonas vaginalis (strain ATCC PRA-98 / G3) TaxID=412133 RepID=A2FAB9_TRIV3|nr:spectrin binding [Trichomonas vaginalis G3]EAX98136.1 hypothetical protein TVAG_332460 [Trichomonas vaginalis G3]KAI5484852.1 spectrin binding [Trichomonas vaginalis G3]|eukprot:XP_001311066.1 hypothetical protein [Trichomonas vaginalis G3]
MNLGTAYDFCKDLQTRLHFSKVPIFIKSYSLRKLLDNDQIIESNSKSPIQNEQIFVFRQNNLHFSQELTHQDILNVYEFKSIEYTLLHDNILKFKEFFQNYSPYTVDCFMSMIDSPHYKELILLDACAYYGASKCFHYLLENGSPISSETFNCAVIGGNPAIIHTCESIPNINISNSAIDLAIKAHRYTVALWLEVKYKLRFSWNSVLETKDYRFLINKIKKIKDINCVDSKRSTLLNAAETYNDTEIINWVIGASNKNPMNLKKLAQWVVKGNVSTYVKNIARF